MNRRRHKSIASAAGAAMLGLSAAAASASLTIDVRATGVTGAGNVVGNAKSVWVSGPGTVSFNVFAIITPAADNGNSQDEAFNQVYGSFLSTGSSYRGSLAATLNPSGDYS